MKKVVFTLLAICIMGTTAAAAADGIGWAELPGRGVLISLPDGKPGEMIRLAPNGRIYYVRTYDTLEPLGPFLPAKETI